MLKKTMFAVLSAAALCAAPLSMQAKTAEKTAPSTTSPSAAASPAAPGSKAEESVTTKPSRPIPFVGKIGTVDKANKTFTIEGKKSTRTFTTTDSTKIEKGGSPASWNDLQAGEYVRGSALKKSEGQYQAMSIKIGPKEQKASTAQPQGKAKKQ